MRWVCLCVAFLLSCSALGDDTGPFSALSFGQGIEIKHPRDLYQVNTRFRLQNQVEAQFGDSPIVSGQVRRARLRFSGFVADPQLRFLLQLSFSRRDMDWDNTGFPNVVRDASVVWWPTDRFQLSFGQSKLPGNRERVVSSGELQFVDRSVVNAKFNIDRDFGVQGSLNGNIGGPVQASLRWAVTTGEGRNTLNPDSGLSYTLRGELLPLGDFTESGDYFESDLAREPRPRVSLGIGASHNDRSTRSAGQLGVSLPGVSRTFQTYFADAIMKYQGLSIYAEWMARRCPNPDAGPSASDPSERIYVLDGQGLNLQAGYFIAPRWEVALRSSWILPSTAVQAWEKRHWQLTAGLNWFLLRHRVKFQTDLSWNETEKPASAAERFWQARFQVELGI